MPRDPRAYLWDARERHMTVVAFMESEVDRVALVWLQRPGWTVKHGPGIAPPRQLAIPKTAHNQRIYGFQKD